MKNNRARGSRGPPAIHNTREGPFMTKSGLLFGAALALTVTAAAAEDLTVHHFFTADHIMQGCRGFVDPNSVRSPIERGGSLPWNNPRRRLHGRQLERIARHAG